VCTEDSFLRDVRDHEITIIKDDGVYRHLRFKRKDSGTFWFDIVTWPGFLAYSGDMGAYMFSRCDDMLDFFRMDSDDFNYKSDKKLNINPYYWSEKLESVSQYGGGTLEYDEDAFRERVTEFFDDYCRDAEFDETQRDELWEEISDSVLSYADEEHRAYDAVSEFSEGDFEFVDFFDAGSTNRYTYHFIWCLYAIVWGIGLYDEKKNG
jgi:hypothetical protein